MSRHFSFTAALDKEVNAMITDKIEFLVDHLLGTPARETAVDMQWDGDADTDIVVGKRGRHRGKFSWRSRGAFGDALALIMSARELDRSSARLYALEWLEEFA